MKADLKKYARDKKMYVLAIIAGIVVNVVLNAIMTLLGIPLYLDTTGTIGVSVLSGMFPGIVIAVATNTLCTLYDSQRIYYGCINILIAIWSAWYAGKRSLKNPKDIGIFVLVAGLVSGCAGASIQWWLIGDTGTSPLHSMLSLMGVTEKSIAFHIFLALNVLTSILDKGMSLGIAMLILHFIPAKTQTMIRNGGWLQNPFFDALVDYTKDFSVRTILILISFFVLILAFGLNMANIHITYPTQSMILSIRDIIRSGSDQGRLDESLKNIRAIDIHTGDEMEKLYQALCDMALDQVEQIRSIARFSENNEKMQDGLIITMADLVENRDSDTGAHVQKTSAYAKIIVEGLRKKGYYAEKITPTFVSEVVRSAPLHDIGKINIPDNVLNKPGKLTKEEFEIMKTHTTAGKKILEKTIHTVGGETYLKEARNMAAYHRERWDGTGYPEKLHREMIPLSARIMAVADVFDALTSVRVYKPAFPLDKALAIIEEGKGTQFDPKCVEVFFESLPEVKEVLEEYRGAN